MNTHDDGGLARDKTLRDEIAIEAIKKMIAGVDLTEDAGSRLAAIVVTQQDGTRATPLLEPIVAEAYELADAIIAEKRTREPTEDAAKHDQRPISILRFDTRISGCLKRAGISTVGKLKACEDLDLLYLRNFGEKSLREVKIRLRMLADEDFRTATDTTKCPPA